MTRKAQQANELLRAGIRQQEGKDRNGAAHTYSRVLELDPHNTFAWYNLGVIAQQEGRTADARAAYDKALKIDPKFTSALYNEAILLRRSEPDRAIGILKRAITVNPQTATAFRLQLGQVLAERGHDDEAEDQFRRVVAASPALLSSVPERFRDSVSPSPTSSQTGSTR
ncbi:tetratricopeptide repeat protein [Streptomyces sp. AK02-04a]|uniref:tetratricopeptide repeat protein n=1 Tax=Streptomyces sp. AK02-04a TaxID=3028649 RepID=UPI0029A837AA|nr:tetratricopeptide repeat protein [Streptomyces sp. AK02-04a]MDX3755817.1 tetratricopeptide repeat protein [Streptomyces sp. AK02-04a]